MESDTMTYARDGYEFTIDVRGNLLQEYCPDTGVTTKFFQDAKEVYYPSLRMTDRYKRNRDGEYVLDYSTFIDFACLGLKIWYDVNQSPSSFALGEIVTNSEYSVMHYSQRKPIVDTYRHKVCKFISLWRSKQFYEISLLVSKLDSQLKTTQKTFEDRFNKQVKELPIL